jgi:KDO2-lipid IV(A) lauroyltransferase
MEAFRLPSLSQAEVLRRQQVFGREHLAAAMEAGRGAVLALPHSGNWDMAGAWVTANGWKLTTVAERLKPEQVYRRFVAYRESVGMEIIPATGGDRPPLDILTDRLRAGNAVPLLADRDLSRRGVEVTFFGGRTRMPAGPAILAIRTGAPLMVVHCWYDDGRPTLRMNPPLTVPEAGSGPLDERVRRLTQDIADGFSGGIGAHPADWHMLQRLWLPPSTGESTGQRAESDSTRG